MNLPTLQEIEIQRYIFMYLKNVISIIVDLATEIRPHLPIDIRGHSVYIVRYKFSYSEEFRDIQIRGT